MFEEKVKLNITEIDNVVEKEICGQKIKFNTYLNQESCLFVISECLDRFIESNNETRNFIIAMNETIRTMNIALCYLSTNIEIENISYDDLYIIGIFKEIKETLINYDEIKTIVISCITLIFDYVIYNTLEKIPSNEQMIDNLEKIKEIFTSNPEKAKEFANIIIANHPELSGFGEVFEKILNNLNKEQ